MRNLLILLLVFVSLQSFSQSEYNFINPDAQYELAQARMEENEYEDAITLLSQINENDSIYRSSVISILGAYFSLKKYEKVDSVYFLHNKVEDDYTRQLDIYYGVSQMRQEKYNEAVKFWGQMLEDKPKDYLLQYNLGNTYDLMENYTKALEHYQLSIAYNAYYAPPHRKMGDICYKNHRISQALICWDMFLTMSPNGDKSNDVLVQANDAVSQSNEEESINITISEDDKAFDEIDMMLSNQIALNSSYKTPSKSTTPFIKQNYALLEMLNNFEGNGGFWSEVYVPMLNKVHSNGWFEPFVYRMISSSGNSSHQKLVSKSAKDQDALVEWFREVWPADIGRKTHPNPPVRYVYADNGDLEAEGLLGDDYKYSGEVKFYTDGSVSALGNFKNGNRAGHWEWFSPSGKITEQIDYADDGTPDGFHIKYHPTGYIKSKVYLKGNSYQGKYELYTKYGILSETGFYTNDELSDSNTYYYPLGKGYPRAVYYYKNGELTGPIYNYHPTGELSMKVQTKEGYRHGKETNYYINGNVSSTYYYNIGDVNGPYKEYYRSGELMQTGRYANNSYDSIWVTYYLNGDIEYETGYSNGRYEGLSVFYPYEQATPSYEYIYHKDDVASYKHYDKKGELINQGEKNAREELFFEGYYSSGIKKSFGWFNKKGDRIGRWVYFDKYANISSTEVFSDGAINGADSTFYPNGNIAGVDIYNNRELNGLSQEFYIDGCLSTIGNYKNGKRDRLQYTYYPDGTLSGKYYYKNDLLVGYQYIYSVDGKLYQRQLFEEGDHIFTDHYDTLGIVYQTMNYYTDSVGVFLFPNGMKNTEYSYINGIQHGTFKGYYLNGKASYKGDYVMGEEHGEWVWYYDNGQVSLKGKYEQGNAIGEWISYHRNGTIENTKTYDANYLQQGASINYNDKGVITYITNYVDGNRHDTSFYYSDIGELQMVRYYHYDELMGYSHPDANGELLAMIPIEKGTAEIETFYANGNPSRKYSFVGGEFNGSYLHYYSNGQVESEDFYLHGHRNGTAIFYYENGSLQTKINYLLNNNHGIYEDYHKNGRIKVRAIFLNDKENGKASYYKENGELEKEIWYFNGEAYDAKYY
jgi:antitoxin component YwqK of YwqJK toxin-antitoxin module